MNIHILLDIITVAELALLTEVCTRCLCTHTEELTGGRNEIHCLEKGRGVSRASAETIKLLIGSI